MNNVILILQPRQTTRGHQHPRPHQGRSSLPRLQPILRPWGLTNLMWLPLFYSIQHLRFPGRTPAFRSN